MTLNAWGLAAWLLVAVAPADAAADRSVETAHQAFARGDFDRAIAAFEAAHARSRDPRLLYNIALSYLKRGQRDRRRDDLLEAKRLFSRFLLVVSPADYPDRDRSRQLRQVRQLAREYLDGLEAQLAQDSTPRRRQPAPLSSRPGVTAEPAVTVERRESRPFPTHWVLYGLAAAAAVSCATVGGLALASSSEAEELLRAGRAEETNAMADRADRLALAADVLLGAAVAAAAAGVVLHVLSRRAAARRLTVVPGLGVTLRYSFR